MKKIKLINFYAFLSLCAITTGCATGSRSKYVPLTESGGYSESNSENSIMITRFAGNAYTSAKDASEFSAFRAVEYCMEKGYKVVRFHKQENNSSSKTVQRTSNYNYQQPTYFSGTANSNTNYNYLGYGQARSNTNTSVNGSFQGGSSYGGGSTWNETYNFPVFDTYFECKNKVLMVGVGVKDITVEDMKPYVKDLMGAIQVIKLTEDSPNQGIIKIGDIVTKVGDNRVQKNIDFISAIHQQDNEKNIEITLLRDGKTKKIKVKATDKTQEVEQEYQNLVYSVCSVPEIKGRPICLKLKEKKN